MDGTHWLSMIAGQKVGQRYAISKKQGTIGRDVSNAIQVFDAEVSRVHCRYQLVGDRLEIADLESANGTLVNGKTIEHSLASHGDQITIGSTVLELHVNELVDANVSENGFSIREKFSAQGPLNSISYFPTGANPSHDSEDAQATAKLTCEPVGMPQVLNDMNFIYQASLSINGGSNSAEMLDELIDLIFKWVTADRCGVLLSKGQTGKLELEAVKLRSVESSERNLAINQSIVNYVRNHRVGILTANASTHRLPGEDDDERIVVREAICVPINGRNEFLGAIYIDVFGPHRKPENTSFDKNHLNLLSTIGLQLGLAIENEQYFEKLLAQHRLVTIGQTTTSLSHHIKNLLQGVNGGAYLVQMGLESEDLKKIETGWDIVNRNQQDISRIVNDMLIFDNPYDPIFKQTDLNEVITYVLKETEPTLSRNNIQCNWTPAAQPVLLLLDQRGIHWALHNLINSCITACHGQKQGVVNVELDFSGSETVAITITDNSLQAEPRGDHDAFSSAAPESLQNMNTVELAVSRKLIRGHNGTVELTHLEAGGNLLVIHLPRNQTGQKQTGQKGTSSD